MTRDPVKRVFVPRDFELLPAGTFCPKKKIVDFSIHENGLTGYSEDFSSIALFIFCILHEI